MTAIAPRRTGIVIFGARVVSILTGLLFVIMVTHSVSTSQFGLLEVITDLIAFATIPLSAINFWVTRDTGRGKLVGKTAVLSNLLLSVLGVCIFSVLAVVKQSPITASLDLFFFSLLLVPVSYFYSTTNAILSTYNPQALGYVLLLSESSKLLVAYLVLFVLKMELTGVILALAVSNMVLGAAALLFIGKTLSGPFSYDQWKKWFRDSWLPALNSVPYVIGIADTFVAFLIAGPTFVGFYQAAFAIAGIVGYCSYLTYALYPLLLRGASERLVGVLFDFMMLFGIPMAVGAAALSPQLLFLLSRNYVGASTPLVILAFAVLVGTGSFLLDSALTGRETADLSEENRFRNLLGSNLFFVPKVNLIYSAVYLSSVAVVVYFGTATALPMITTITYWSVLQLVLLIGLFWAKLRRIGRGALQGTGRPLSYYALCSLVMGGAVYLVGRLFLSYDMAALTFGLRLGATVGLGAVVYFGVLAAVDRRSRERLSRIAGLLLSRRAATNQDAPAVQP